MKRVVLTLLGTVAGLVSLLSFKTESHPLALGAGGLPAAALSGGSGSSATPTTVPSTVPSGSSASSKKSNSPTTSAPPVPKAYLGSAVTTRYGVIQVKVTVSGGRITNVAFVQLQAFDGRSQEINSMAAPTLLQETLTAQSAKVDTVSGATYTSDGYRQSLQSALDVAGIK